MNTRCLSKQRLIALKKQAEKAGGNHIDPQFLQTIPSRFKYPVCCAVPVPLERWWVRCWVTIGTDDPPLAENIHHLLLDMPIQVFENLPVVEAPDQPRKPAEKLKNGRRTT
jgi:hypothetical protein